MNTKNGNNQFKRALRDAKETNITDARNTTGLALIDPTPNTTIVQDFTGKKYIQVLPNTRHTDTDAKQLKVFPSYRLIDENVLNNNVLNNNVSNNNVPNNNLQNNNNSMQNSTTVTQSDGLIDSNLNEDVTEFLRILNDVGSRISYFLDPANANDFAPSREIVSDKLGMDSISSNIIRGVEDLKAFFYEFGKKIAPAGVNPYRNNDCMRLLRTEYKDGQRQTTVNNNITSDEIDYESGPYNPSDLNTYMNCLETLSRRSTFRETNSDYDDFNLKVFQSIITKTKTTKFIDSEIDELRVTRPLPFYNPIHLMIEILKIDTKLFNILYLLNLHNTSRSPITGVYYGKVRTKINENGFPVLSDVVTSTDIHNATIQTLDFIGCILKLITFIDLDAYNKIIEDHFSISAVDVVPAAGDTPIIIDDSAASNNFTQSGTVENIPTFLYGQLLSFADAARQAVNEIIIGTFPNSPLYNPSKVANIAYNTTYGLLAVAQLIEGLLKSRCFAIIMSMLFPSGTFNPDSQLVTGARNVNGLSRLSDVDMQSITRQSIDGIPLDITKVVPPKSIPNYIPDDNISINKAVFCTIITALCGISRFLWNSNAPCLRLCDLTDKGVFDPERDYDPNSGIFDESVRSPDSDRESFDRDSRSVDSNRRSHRKVRRFDPTSRSLDPIRRSLPAGRQFQPARLDLPQPITFNPITREFFEQDRGVANQNERTIGSNLESANQNPVNANVEEFNQVRGTRRRRNRRSIQPDTLNNLIPTTTMPPNCLDIDVDDDDNDVQLKISDDSDGSVSPSNACDNSYDSSCDNSCDDSYDSDSYFSNTRHINTRSKYSGDSNSTRCRNSKSKSSIGCSKSSVSSKYDNDCNKSYMSSNSSDDCSKSYSSKYSNDCSKSYISSKSKCSSDSGKSCSSSKSKDSSECSKSNISSKSKYCNEYDKRNYIDVEPRYNAYFNSRVPLSNRAVRSSQASRVLPSNRASYEINNSPDLQNFNSLQDMIKYLQENTFPSVLTENGKVFTFFQVYVSAFASHDRLTYNDRVARNRSVTHPSAINRDLYSMLSKGINF